MKALDMTNTVRVNRDRGHECRTNQINDLEASVVVTVLKRWQFDYAVIGVASAFEFLREDRMCNL